MVVNDLRRGAGSGFLREAAEMPPCGKLIFRDAGTGRSSRLVVSFGGETLLLPPPLTAAFAAGDVAVEEENSQCVLVVDTRRIFIWVQPSSSTVLAAETASAASTLATPDT